MNYMMKLRDKMGNEPLIMVGSTVMIKDKTGKILLQKRSDTGKWSTIGGAMELGESFEETAIREVQEETSLKIIKMELKDVLSGSDMFHEYPHGDVINLVTAVFEVTEWEGTPQVNDHESLDFRFFDLRIEVENLDTLARRILEKTDYIND
ncbi:NUDIX hydrolase [Candidatus Cloacimonadota bacterium]